MKTVDRFEDLRIWQQAREQARQLYALRGPVSFQRDFAFRDQLQRAAISVMNNIAEGFEHASDADFRRFLGHAKASNGETRSMLYVAEDIGYLPATEASRLREQSVALSSGIGALSRHLNPNRPTPQKS